jgi:hypothetical protein
VRKLFEAQGQLLMLPLGSTSLFVLLGTRSIKRMPWIEEDLPSIAGRSEPELAFGARPLEGLGVDLVSLHREPLNVSRTHVDNLLDGGLKWLGDS